MKLVLSNNQSEKFKEFFSDLKSRTKEPFDYSGYRSLLFVFDPEAERKVEISNLSTGRKLSDYDGIYINSYLNCYELAAATAMACQSLKISFVNQELSDPPSLSKLTMYAKLAAAKVRFPYSIAGTKAAIANAKDEVKYFKYPAVLKRADADRGIDNFLVKNEKEVLESLEKHDSKSLWVLQEFVPNDGYYLISFYEQKPVFCIYRSLESRPDKNESKAHMYKPKGGKNAKLIELENVPAPLLEVSTRAVVAMNRQIASVDSLYDSQTRQTNVLEVNYNPQLVTIETLKEVRQKAFVDFIDRPWLNN